MSCERVFKPKSQHKTLAVLSNNDGCAISRSNEAEKLSIPMEAPALEIRKQFKAHDLKIYCSNYALYSNLSHCITNTLRAYCLDLEIYSIDESFLLFTGYEQCDLGAHAIKMRKEVLQHTLIPTCAGIAPTKASAKVANAIANKFPELEGIYAIDSEKKCIKALK